MVGSWVGSAGASTSGSSRLPKASDLLVASIRAEILQGRLKPGDRLPPESELVRSGKFSRSTVREALRLLEIEGLVEIRRGRNGGAHARHPGISSISNSFAAMLTIQRTPLRDFMAFRRFVEPFIAAEAAARATNEQRRELEELVERTRSDYATAMADFHSYLGHCSGNGVFSMVLDAVHPLFERHIRTEFVEQDDIIASNEAHTRVAGHIVAGRVEEARYYMGVHLEGLEQYLNDRELLDAPIVPPAVWSRTYLDVRAVSDASVDGSQ